MRIAQPLSDREDVLDMEPKATFMYPLRSANSCSCSRALLRDPEALEVVGELLSPHSCKVVVLVHVCGQRFAVYRTQLLARPQAPLVVHDLASALVTIGQHKQGSIAHTWFCNLLGLGLGSSLAFVDGLGVV
jgi:hypothetical protein